MFLEGLGSESVKYQQVLGIKNHWKPYGSFLRENNMR